MANQDDPAIPQNAPRKRLGVVDCVSIMVGIIIGAGIYETIPSVAGQVNSASILLIVWIAGGLISVIGALCFAELATRYPQDGGDYIYLTRAFGNGTGFLFGWTGFFIVWPGNLGVMAHVFGGYGKRLLDLGVGSAIVYAIGAVVLIALLNILGVRSGKWTQNLLSGTKVLGLLAVIGVGLFGPMPAEAADTPVIDEQANTVNLSLAMVLVLFAFGGWRDVAFVAAEVHEPRKNILRSLLVGLAVVTGIYLLMNVAMISGYGYERMAGKSGAVSEMMAATIGPMGDRCLSTLICISALGAINGMLFTGSRMFYRMGREHRTFRLLGEWSATYGTPARAIAMQSVLCTILLLSMGNADGANRFERLVVFSAPVFWAFFTMTGLSLFVLRSKERGNENAFRVPLYPLTPLLFVASSLFMLYASVTYAIDNFQPEAMIVIVMTVVGMAIYLGSPKPPRHMGMDKE